MIIKLFELFEADTLRHRDTAISVIEMINKATDNNPIIIDFSRIVFTTRSFLNELISGLQDKNVKYVNMSPELENMMKVVLESALENSKHVAEC